MRDEGLEFLDEKLERNSSIYLTSIHMIKHITKNI